jgi:hypothetical protein
MEMPFGKYRGTQIRELPFNYLEWLTTLELLEPLQTRVQEEYESACTIRVEKAPLI